MTKIKAKHDIKTVHESVLNTTLQLRQHISGKKTSKEYIHRIRVDIKHLRAWLRLIKNKCNHRNWQTIDQRLSNCAEQLGSIRDDQVILNTLDFLHDHFKTKKERAAIAFVKKQLARNSNNTNIDLDKISKELIESLIIFEQDYIEVMSPNELRKALKNTFKKCEHFSRIVFSDKVSDNDLHKLRKWIKNFYYQSCYIRKVCPVNKKLLNDIHKLGDKLGEAHDLIIIKERFKSLDETDITVAIYSLINKRIALILKKAEPKYIKLFNSSRLDKIL